MQIIIQWPYKLFFFNDSLVYLSGSRSGAIHHHDVRVPDHHVGSLIEHTQEVCGLTWAPDGRHLASGGNDNVVNVWDTTLALEGVSPVQTFTHHLAAVKVETVWIMIKFNSYIKYKILRNLSHSNP